MSEQTVVRIEFDYYLGFGDRRAKTIIHGKEEEIAAKVAAWVSSVLKPRPEFKSTKDTHTEARHRVSRSQAPSSNYRGD